MAQLTIACNLLHDYSIMYLTKTKDDLPENLYEINIMLFTFLVECSNQLIFLKILTLQWLGHVCDMCNLFFSSNST